MRKNNTRMKDLESLVRSWTTVRNGTRIWVHPALVRRLRGHQPPGPPLSTSSGACDSEHRLLGSAGSFSSTTDLAHKPWSSSSKMFQHTRPHWEFSVASALLTRGCARPMAICYSALSLAEWPQDSGHALLCSLVSPNLWKHRHLCSLTSRLWAEDPTRRGCPLWRCKMTIQTLG